MKAHKVTLLIIDMDDIGTEELRLAIEETRYPNRCISPEVYKIDTVDIGEWSDDHPLNQIETANYEWQRLFPELKDLFTR